METLSQCVTDILRDWILHGHFQAGQRIEEIPLATALAVSRTPVRSALATLITEGLIVYQPKNGYVVREFDLRDILLAYEVRATLEGLGCRRAAITGLSETQRDTLSECLATGDRILSKGVLDPAEHQPYQKMNVELHNTLLTASDNPWLERFVVQADNIPYASNRIVLWDEPFDVIYRSHGDHHRIVEAVLERDDARAEYLMREHVYYAGVIFKRNFEHRMTQGASRQSAAPLAVSPKTALDLDRLSTKTGKRPKGLVPVGPASG